MIYEFNIRKDSSIALKKSLVMKVMNFLEDYNVKYRLESSSNGFVISLDSNDIDAALVEWIIDYLQILNDRKTVNVSGLSEL